MNAGPQPDPALRLPVSFGNAGNPARIDHAEPMTWDALAALLTAGAPVSEDKASRGWYIPGEFRGDTRDGESLIARSALTLDYDAITFEDAAAIERALAPYAYVLHTTASHTADKPRLRAVLPLSRPASPDEFGAVSRKVAALPGIELASRESHTPAQMMYLPTVKPGGKFKAKRNTGKPVDVDAILASYADWTDRASWPRRAEHDDTRKPEPGTDPRQKPGAVGDFCRAYSVPEAIEAFGLPYRHEHGNRWTYLHGHSKDGAVVYDDGTKLHSHHDTDPARGQHNAFDLVRLHRFGHLDRGADPQAQPWTLPSYQALVQDFATRPEFHAQRAADFDVLPSNPAEPSAPTTGEPLGRNLGEVWARPTEPAWLLPDVIEAGVIAILAGPRGSYKSFLALDWGMRAALAGQPVYFVSAEGGDFDRRARAWQLHHGTDGAARLADNVRVVERRLDLNKGDGIGRVQADVAEWQRTPRLFVLDTLSKLSGGLDENDNTEVKQFIGRLDRELRRKYGATVLIVAHTGHSETGRPRGASALGADTDAEYIVSRRPGLAYISVSRERFKSSPELPPLHMEALPVDLGRVDGRGVPVTSLVLAPCEPRTRGAIRGPKGATQHAVFAAVPDGGETVSEAEVIAEVLPKVRHDPRDSASLRDAKKTVKRAITALVDGELLFIKDGRISRTRVVPDDPESLAEKITGPQREAEARMRKAR